MFVRNDSIFYVLKQETAITTLHLISLASHRELVKVKEGASAFHSNPATPQPKKKVDKVRERASRNFLWSLDTKDVLGPLGSMEKVEPRHNFQPVDGFLFFLLII